MKTLTTPRSTSRRAFTLVELLTVIAIIGVLAAIIIPVVGKMKASARQTECSSNLRQIGAGFLLYLGENRNLFPPVNDNGIWFMKLTPYLQKEETDSSKLAEVFMCPTWKDSYTPSSATDWNRLGYGMSYVMVGSPSTGWPWSSGESVTYQVRASDIVNPTRTVLVAENGGWNWGTHSGNVDTYIAPSHGNARARRHDASANYLFADGHVQKLAPTRDALMPFLAR